MTQSTGLFDLLPPGKSNLLPLSFEDLNQDYGFVLYRTFLEGGREGWLHIDGLRDYGIIFLNGKRTGVLDRRLKQDSLRIQLPQGRVRLDILVENLGRINFGPYLLQNRKGITGSVSFAKKELRNWHMYSLPFNHLNFHSKKSKGQASGVPVLKKGNFNLDDPGDTYLDMRAWGKGSVWINGHHLGRYWNIGPQQTIYVPAEWLKKGRNEIAVWELLEPDQVNMVTRPTPILNELKKQK